LWYSSRYAELPADLHDLSRKLAESENAIVIIDKLSYGKLSHQIQPRTPEILGQSDNFVCFRSH